VSPELATEIEPSSKGLADDSYCEVLEKEATNTAEYLLDRAYWPDCSCAPIGPEVLTGSPYRCSIEY
jgi:hypothetical protein